MKQSNKNAKTYYATDAEVRYSLKNREKTAFIYVRISRDDELEGESNSIQNQIKLLTQIAKEYGYTVLIVFVDDGITGVTTKRPGFLNMLEKLEQGYAAALFVKDLSRLYRNRTEADKLIDDFLPEHEVRLISVGDSFDSAEGDDEFIFLRNWANEQYARDISKKRRLSNRVRGNAGEPLGPPPFGYMKDPDNPKRWIIDDEAAAVVRRIYRLTMEGRGTGQIAAQFTAERILTPVFYLRNKGIKRPTKTKATHEPHKWNQSSVQKILSLQEYCGDVINFKTYSKSFKNKARIENDPENMAIFMDVHESIIERELWERVQQKRQNSTVKQPTKKSEPNMFAGLLFCADCGGRLNYHFNQKNQDIKYFNCSNNNSCQKTCLQTHYIRLDFLEQVVLAEIRRLSQFVTRHEDAFTEAVIGYAMQTADAEKQRNQRRLKSLVTRDKELDKLFERTYEDNASGKLSDERYAKMTKSYEDEQSELSVQIKALREELDAGAAEAMTTESFMVTVRKYNRSRKLSPEMLNELISRIEVYHAEKIDGVHVQKLTIHYNCIGSIEIPDCAGIAKPDVSVGITRGQGSIELHYASAEKAVEVEYESAS